MIDLDNLEELKKLDKKKVSVSIGNLPLQCQQAWQETQKLGFPADYDEVANIVIVGMGGSGYGVRIVKSLYDGAQMTKVPVESANGYWLPGYVDSNTLVILSSYSGNTEETLECAKQAKEKGAKIAVLTSGGKLAFFLQTNNYPAYIFNPIHNPSGQPRVGAGYMVMGLIGILANLGKIPVGQNEIDNMITFIEKQNLLLKETASTDKNPAKQMAVRLVKKIPVMIVADFLDGAAYAVRNPFHETAKQFALYFAVPELNHHLLEALSFPPLLKNILHFIFVESIIYDKRNIKRMALTQEVIKKNNIPSETFYLSGSSALTQVIELIQWGAWLTFYLAILHDIDPAEIPLVDYFKKELQKDKI